MQNSHAFPRLRTILLVDAATCVGMGALLALASSAVGALTLIPSDLLFFAGVSLFPIAAFMAFAAIRPDAWPLAGRLVVVGNLAWVGGSLVLLIGGVVPLNAIGCGFVLVQAAAVAVFAGLEYGALQRGRLPQSQVTAVAR